MQYLPGSPAQMHHCFKTPDRIDYFIDLRHCRSFNAFGHFVPYVYFTCLQSLEAATLTITVLQYTQVSSSDGQYQDF